MKAKIKWICIISIFFIQSSCNNFKQESPFEVVEVSKKLFTYNGSYYLFTFKGSVKNNSVNIYDSVYTMVSIELELENGNIITARDYQSVFWGIDIGDLEKAWKPNEVRIIGEKKGINSDFIPKQYKEYPVKKVTAVLKFSADDIINRSKNEYYYRLDVTDVWNRL